MEVGLWFVSFSARSTHGRAEKYVQGLKVGDLSEDLVGDGRIILE
jgi:hypothetical protein